MVKKEKYYKIDKRTAGIAAVVIIVIAVLLGVYFKGGFGPTEELKGETPDVATPAPVFELIVIENPDCEECMNATQAMQIIKGSPKANITSDRLLSFEDEEAEDLIEKYEIERLPAFILKGKNLDINLEPFEKKDDALVFDKIPPIYYDLEDERAVGAVEMTVITKEDCDDCADLSRLFEQLKQVGMVITKETTLEYDSEEGEELLEKYDITKVPTLLFSKDAAEYDIIKEAWSQLGSTEEDGTLVMRQVNPPYYDLESETVKGIVDITYLVDEECDDCMDPEELTNMLESNAAMKFGDEDTVDISSDEGEDMIEEYNITLVPTVILSSDAKEYLLISQNWGQVGIEVDGEYVFTAVDKLNKPYKDLSTGEILNLQEEEPEDAEATDEGLEVPEVVIEKGDSEEEAEE